jgi:hypothetical protein
MQQADGVVDGTKVPLRILDLHPNTLRHRMSKLGIQRSPTASRDSFLNASPAPTKCGGPSILCGRSPAQKPEGFGFAPDVFKSSANPRNLLTELGQ